MPGSKPESRRRATRLRQNQLLRLNNRKALPERERPPRNASQRDKFCARATHSSPRSVARRRIFLAAEAARFAHANVKTSCALATANAPWTGTATTKLLHSNGVQSAPSAANFVRSFCRSAARKMRSDRPFGRRLDADRASLFRLRCERVSRIRPRTPFRTMAGRFVNLEEARRVRPVAASAVATQSGAPFKVECASIHPRGDAKPAARRAGPRLSIGRLSDYALSTDLSGFRRCSRLLGSGLATPRRLVWGGARVRATPPGGAARPYRRRYSPG
jgi:hypothetical protein